MRRRLEKTRPGKRVASQLPLGIIEWARAHPCRNSSAGARWKNQCESMRTKSERRKKTGKRRRWLQKIRRQEAERWRNEERGKVQEQRTCRIKTGKEPSSIPQGASEKESQQLAGGTKWVSVSGIPSPRPPILSYPFSPLGYKADNSPNYFHLGSLVNCCCFARAGVGGFPIAHSPPILPLPRPPWCHLPTYSAAATLSCGSY